MGQPVHEYLAKLYGKLGDEIFQDPASLRRHLRRLCRGRPADGDALAACIDLDLPRILLRSQLDWEELEPLVIKQVAQERALPIDDIRWAVRSWAVGLGRASLAEANPEPPEIPQPVVPRDVYSEFAPQRSVAGTAMNWLTRLCLALVLGFAFGAGYGVVLAHAWGYDHYAKLYVRSCSTCANPYPRPPQPEVFYTAFALATGTFGVIGSLVVLFSDIEANADRHLRNALVGSAGGLAAWSMTQFGIVWAGVGLSLTMLIFLTVTLPLSFSAFLRENFHV